ncbi:MAG: type IV pilin N-terminal domain-containing protein [Candidatus Methanomethylophilaceae archaeon]|jgi:FlaG/FlaF family flagellin (archaellin)
MKLNNKDDGVTSVVGEMLLIALVLILVSLFAASAFNLLPGNRETVIDVSMNLATNGNDTILYFWHKGGDWVDGDELTASLTNNGTKYVLEKLYLTDCRNETKTVFDLGGCYAVQIPKTISGNSSLRLSTSDSVIYAKELIL